MVAWFRASLRNWLVGIVCIGLGMVSAVALSVIVTLSSSLDDYHRLLESSIAVERGVLRTNRMFKEQVQEWKNVLLRGVDDASREKYWTQFIHTEEAVRQNVELLFSQAQEPKTVELLQAFLSSHTRMGEAYREGFRRFVASGFDSSVGDAAVEGIDREPTQTLTEAAEYVSELVEDEAQQVENRAETIAVISVPAVAGAAAVIVLALFWFLNRSVVLPARELVRVIRAYGEGDFRGAPNLGRQDEFGVLAQGLAAMRENISGLLAQMQRMSDGLRQTSTRLTGTAEAIVQNVSQVSDRTQESASAVEEMAATVQEVARNAAEAAQAADAAGRYTQTGLEAMNQTLTSARETDEVVQGLEQAMEALDKDVLEVGKVVNVIREVAEQTNLLALNAAIESARAGDVGRGFAVVADEVRTLASRTQASTDEIRSLIEHLEEAAATAKDFTVRGRSHTQQTLERTHQTGDNVRQVEQSVSTMREMNLQIATATEEQSSVSENINQNIAEVAGLADQSRDGASNVAAEAERLNGLAHELGEMFARFKVQDAGK